MTQNSAHIQTLTRDVETAVKQAANTDYVKMVCPRQDDPFPGKKVVARWQTDNEQSYVADGAIGAERWWRDYGHEIDARPWVWAWEVADNEPAAKDPAGIAVIIAYECRWIDIAHERDKLTVALNFARGCPEIEVAPFYAPVVRKTDFVGFHEYWLLEGPHDPKFYTWHCQRYRRFFAACGVEKPTFITEAGIARGDPRSWRDAGISSERYSTECREYREECSKDKLSVLAVFYFTSGGGYKWRNFEIDGNTLAQILAGNPPDSGPVLPVLDQEVIVPLGSIHAIKKVVLPMMNLGRKWYAAHSVWTYEHHPPCFDWNTEEGGNSDLGEPLGSPFAGLVITAKDLSGGWGNVARIVGVEPSGRVVCWHGAHLQKIAVRPGQIVFLGQFIGTIGNTGTTWAHLHEQINYDTIPPERTLGHADSAYDYVACDQFYQEHGVDPALLARVIGYDRR